MVKQNKIMILRISNVKSAEDSKATILTSSANKEYKVIMVMTTWYDILLLKMIYLINAFLIS